jgi:hypothetical protein
LEHKKVTFGSSVDFFSYTHDSSKFCLKALKLTTNLSYSRQVSPL